MIRLLPLLLLAGLGTAASADPRITTRPFEAANVVTVHGKPGIETTIAFADDERIENVAVGNSAAWQVTPNKRANLLFVKPSGVHAHTNMTVITDQHTYLFDLVSGAGLQPVYMLRFSYPGKPRPAPVVAAAIPVPIAPVATPPAPVEVASTTPGPADLDFAWIKAGDRRLLPERVFDDGRRTFLAWPKDAVLPAVLTRNATGQEGPVNFSVQGAYLVVDGVPAQILLRAGKQLATLTPAPSGTRGQAPPDAVPPGPETALAETGSTRP